MVTPAARREAVTILVETYEMSERRACQVIGADRSSVRYASRRPDDTALRERMKEVAHDRRRFGYRRVHVLLKAEGLVVNRKKTERLYREEGLKVRRRRGRRRAMGTRAPIPVIARANARWSLDFVHDQLTSGTSVPNVLWNGVHLERRARVGSGQDFRLALHRSRQANAERILRVLWRRVLR